MQLVPVKKQRCGYDFSYDCDYIKSNEHRNFSVRYEEVSKMLNGLLEKWQTF